MNSTGSAQDFENTNPDGQAGRICLNSLGRMASAIAHDFNNFLMPILGLTDFVLTDPDIINDPKELTEILHEISDAASAAKAHAAKFRDFYRPVDEGNAAPFSAVSAVDHAITAVEQVRNNVVAGKVSIKVNDGLKALPLLGGVESQIACAVAALITNSIEAMPRGGSISIDGHQDGAWVRISVSDTGIGMTEEIRIKCLEPLFTTKILRGAGVGLSSVYGIVRRHDGAIAIKSSPSGGTTITLWLPTIEALELQNRAAELLEPFVKHRILIADIDLWTVGRIRRFLNYDQHVPEAVSTGADAMRLAQSHNYDLVIVGSSLLDTTPESLVTNLERIAPDLPVILVPPHPVRVPQYHNLPERAVTLIQHPITHAALQVAMAHALKD